VAARDAEVAELHLRQMGQEDVRRRHVPMDDVAVPTVFVSELVGEVERVEDLGRLDGAFQNSCAVTTRRMLQAKPEDRITPYDLTSLFVRGNSGNSGAASSTLGSPTNQLIPLSNLVTLQERARPQQLNRVDRVRSITITATPAPGTTIGQALEALDAYAAEVLPATHRHTYSGQSLEFRESSTALYFTFALALLSEGLCSLVVASGFLARFASRPIVFAMVLVLVLAARGCEGSDVQSALLYALPYAVVVLTGPGRWSIDHHLLPRYEAQWRRLCPGAPRVVTDDAP